MAVWTTDALMMLAIALLTDWDGVITVCTVSSQQHPTVYVPQAPVVTRELPLSPEERFSRSVTSASVLVRLSSRLVPPEQSLMMIHVKA